MKQQNPTSSKAIQGRHNSQPKNQPEPFFSPSARFLEQEIMQKKGELFFSKTPNNQSFNPIQRQENQEEEVMQGKFTPIRKKPQTLLPAVENRTGLPDNLKAGIENLSGYSMDDVKVHRNSGKPSQLQAHAYAQGTDIHLAPGQEKHLPHEAWHVVQQKQGRVKPTMQMQSEDPDLSGKRGVKVNDDAALEREADVMGGKAAMVPTVSGRLQPKRDPHHYPQVTDNIVQYKQETVKVKGTTHLVEPQERSLLNGAEKETVRTNDELTVDTEKQAHSRRGILAEKIKSYYGERGHEFIWYKTLRAPFDFNGTRYVRAEMLDETLITRGEEEQSSDLDPYEPVPVGLRFARALAVQGGNLAESAGNQLERLEILLQQVKGRTPKGQQKLEAARAELDSQTERVRDRVQDTVRVQNDANQALTADQVSKNYASGLISQSSELVSGGLETLKTIEEQTVYFGQNSFDIVKDDDVGKALWAQAVDIGDEAYNLRQVGRAKAMELVAEVDSSGKEKAAGIWGNFATLWDFFGISAAIVGLTKVAEATRTFLGQLAGVIGVGLALIAAELAFFSVYFTGVRIKDLQKVLDQLLAKGADQATIARVEYAINQKNTKRKRQATVGVAAGVVAAMGIAGLFAAPPVGVALAVLGALVGFGFILFKWWRKSKGKKKAIAGLLREAAIEPSEGRRALLQMGFTESELNLATTPEGANALSPRIEQALKDRRIQTANQLVDLLVNGKPSEQVMSSATISALGKDPEKLKKLTTSGKKKEAVSTLASKLQSW